MKIADSPVYLKNLSQLRKNQRVDKTKSGRKQPRKFDLVPIRDLYTLDEAEDIQLDLDSSYEQLPRSTVDDAIEAVVAKATVEKDSTTEPGDAKLWCLCRQESSGEMIGCDNLECEVEWFHFSCLNLSSAPEGVCFCPNCRGNYSTKRKLDFEEENPKQPKKSKPQKSKCPNCDKLYANAYLKTHVKKYCLAIK